MQTKEPAPRKPRPSEIILISCISLAVATFGVFAIVQERFIGKTRHSEVVVSEGWPAIWFGASFIGFAMIMLSIILPRRVRFGVLGCGSFITVVSIMLALTRYFY
jgi:hypothetical protein